MINNLDLFKINKESSLEISDIFFITNTDGTFTFVSPSWTVPLGHETFMKL